jgi:coproporphyrinogen III oxidase-like Fe-S oxidoreductase
MKYEEMIKDLEMRMSKQQRHRLLHGFPMSSGMEPLEWGDQLQFEHLAHLAEKPLAVGIIPHTACTPAVKGCGFCTFPNESYNKEIVDRCIKAVCNEINMFSRRFPKTLKNLVSALYFGGGTANLISLEQAELLFSSVLSHFNFEKKAEITLEGTPIRFTDELLELFSCKFQDYTPRISIGIQTFDAEILKLMGRTQLNQNVEKVIKKAQDLGIKCSADFLFNLPGQTTHQILSDVDKAIELDLKHICFYNLVCFPGLGTPWSQDLEILNRLPNRNLNYQNWIDLYNHLETKGYAPITVTDFGKKDSGNASGYRYEECLRSPERYDWLGFGPAAISSLYHPRFTNGIKIINFDNMDGYTQLINRKRIGWKNAFKYQRDDMIIFWLTRQIKGTFIDPARYNLLFHEDFVEKWSKWLSLMVQYELLLFKDNMWRLTPKGMFYADSMAGSLAVKRVQDLTRRHVRDTPTSPQHVRMRPYNQLGSMRNRTYSKRFTNDSIDDYMG